MKWVGKDFGKILSEDEDVRDERDRVDAARDGRGKANKSSFVDYHWFVYEAPCRCGQLWRPVYCPKSPHMCRVRVATPNGLMADSSQQIFSKRMIN